VTGEEAREKLRELTVLVEALRKQAMLHPDDTQAEEAWRESRRDLNTVAALADLLGHREIAARLRKKART
jgi:hypothetical protein